MNNPTTTGSLEFRRRAIYTALRNFMNDEQGLQTLCIWQEYCAAGPMYARPNYISLFAKISICNIYTVKCIVAWSGH